MSQLDLSKQQSILTAMAKMTEATPAVIEGYLTLIADLNQILSNDWNQMPSEHIKRSINYAIQRSLNIVI